MDGIRGQTIPVENEKLNRINALARLAKERALTAEELAERDALRKEYIAEWRRGAEQVLENTYIVGPDGKKRKLERKPRHSSQDGM
jgi:uncharacterized protein YnzC (UPF0291/DUF896 family)